jgi:pilus assembly protein TadC
MGRFQDLISDRYNFAGLYATIILTAGLFDFFFLLFAGFAPLQLIVHLVVSMADGSFFLYDSSGRALSGSAVVFYAIIIAPFFLIYLAHVRGRRIGRRSLVVFPILSIAVVLIGGHPPTANAGLWSLIAWLLNGLCLYYGAWRWCARDER